jgi:hypothetical protein
MTWDPKRAAFDMLPEKLVGIQKRMPMEVDCPGRGKYSVGHPRFLPKMGRAFLVT